MQKIVQHPRLGEILYVKSTRNRSIKASVGRERKIRVSFPPFLPYRVAMEFVETNIEKLLLLKSRMNSCPAPCTAKELEQIRLLAHNSLPERLARQAERLNKTIRVRNGMGIALSSPFSYNRLFIKNNRSNWGSCSSKRNINLNMHLVRLPDELCDYVIIHELCHLVYPNHGKKFHTLMDLACRGKEKEYSRRLRKYSSLLG